MTAAHLHPAIPQLPCADIETTAKFFERTLGFEVIAKYPQNNLVIVRREQAEIHFWQASSAAEARAIASQSSCYIRVDNIESLFAELKQNAAPFRFELTKQPWGMHELQIDDPDGNAIRFGERIV